LKIIYFGRFATSGCIIVHVVYSDDRCYGHSAPLVITSVSYSTLVPVNTGMGDHCRQVNHLHVQPKIQANLAWPALLGANASKSWEETGTACYISPDIRQITRSRHQLVSTERLQEWRKTSLHGPELLGFNLKIMLRNISKWSSS